jgi:uncharacterized protein (UPF0276 family)
MIHQTPHTVVQIAEAAVAAGEADVEDAGVAVATNLPLSGSGIGWRPELSASIACLPSLSFIEIIAESFWHCQQLPDPFKCLLNRGIEIVPHGISLGLAGADYPDRDHLKRLASLAQLLDAPCVSEHVAFVRANGIESGHLLPVPRNKETLAVLIENTKMAMDILQRPLALENIANRVEPPGSIMPEWDFLHELVDRTGCWLLLDLENLHARARSHHFNPIEQLASFPLHRVAYLHLAGGIEHDGKYHDTHDQPVGDDTLAILKVLQAKNPALAFCLERDGNWPRLRELSAEMDRLRPYVMVDRM